MPDELRWTWIDKPTPYADGFDFIEYNGWAYIKTTYRDAIYWVQEKGWVQSGSELMGNRVFIEPEPDAGMKFDVELHQGFTGKGYIVKFKVE